MVITPERLQTISIFSKLEPEQLAPLIPYASTKQYLQGEIIMHEGDRLPPRLFALLQGVIQIKKTASTGKETILRTLEAGEPFAAPSAFGDGISPATVVAQEDCVILMIERSALMDAIRQTPELAFQIMAVLTERMQHLHTVVHGLVSERAIVRLAQFIQAVATHQGTEMTEKGLFLRSRLPYYQIARSIGITYEECVRLFKQLKPIVCYRRGGKILLQDLEKLELIAQGEYSIL
ncbi:MAG: Crp/Fnr family transcriptional regulator [Cyanobacteria bacterium CRU_2_1]|nr:Crp/Fnr family transcriptional regulator [Hydrococcus sp. RU_2_2]NJR58140.1 Crp/Fnr family transcriptional regulator [Cyanobacteria bacterium CRU_2_1]